MYRKFDPICAPQQDLIEAIRESFVPNLKREYKGREDGIGPLVFALHHTYLGNNGILRFSTVRDSFVPEAYIETSSIEETVRFEARARQCIAIADARGIDWQRMIGRGYIDKREAAIAYVASTIEHHYRIMAESDGDTAYEGVIDRYLHEIESLPLAERALYIFTGRSIEDLLPEAREYMRLQPTRSLAGHIVDLFGFVEICDETQTIQELEREIQIAQSDLERRKMRYIEQLDIALRERLQTRGSLGEFQWDGSKRRETRERGVDTNTIDLYERTKVIKDQEPTLTRQQVTDKLNDATGWNVSVDMVKHAWDQCAPGTWTKGKRNAIRPKY